MKQHIWKAATATGLLVTTALALHPSQSLAQTGERSFGLEEIVVTARKREESLQTVPVAISAIPTGQIERFDITSLEKLASFTPTLNIGRASSGSGAQITMRGIGSPFTSVGVEQSTAVVVDGVYYGQGHFLNEALFDLDRIEILKGPQALFFGKNATAGVISVTTAGPTDTLEAMARVGWEFRSENLIGEAYASGPLSDTLGIRVAVRASSMFDGYFTNRATPVTVNMLDLATGDIIPRVQQPNGGDQPGSDELFGRATLRWQPTERLTATLKASASRNKDESNSWNYVPFACPTGFTQPNPDVACRKDFSVYVPNAPEGMGGNIPYMRDDGATYNLYKSFAVTGTIDYALDNMTVTSVSNYNWMNNKWGLAQNVHSPTTFIAATQNTTFWAWSNETRVTTQFDSPVNLMIGGYYQKSKRDHFQAGSLAPLEDSSLPLDRRFLSYSKPSETDGETIAGFGQVMWQVTPEIELAGGVRYTHETKDSFLVQDYVMSALQPLFLEGHVISVDQTFNDWSPEATITWQPTDNITAYGAYKTAYKSGGFSNSGLVTPHTGPEHIAFQPEKASGFELGLKTMLLENQLRLNLAAYTYKYKNLQVDFFDSITFQYITTNAGAARVKGVELEAAYAPNAVPGLTMQGSLNYNRSRYLDYIAPCYGGQSIAAGCNTTFLGGFGQDLSGFPTAMAPDWTATLGADYETPLSDSLVMGVSSHARYSDSYLASAFGMPLAQQGSFITLDASVRLRTADDRWELAVIGRNLTNRFIVNGVVDLPNSGVGTGTSNALAADQIGLVELPRTVRVQLTWRY